MPHLLHDLKISRVALVDCGAGEGVRVKLWKRAGDGDHQGRDHIMRKLNDAAVNAIVGKYLESITKGLVVSVSRRGKDLTQRRRMSFASLAAPRPRSPETAQRAPHQGDSSNRTVNAN